MFKIKEIFQDFKEIHQYFFEIFLYFYFPFKRFCVKFYSTKIVQKFIELRKNKPVGTALAVALPVFSVLVIELTQMQSFSLLFEFVFKRTSVFIFDVLFVGLVYAGLLCIVKRAWLASVTILALCYAFALTEYFKHKSSGIHFDIADIVMVKDMNQLTKFGGVAINSWIAVTFLLLFLYVFALFWFRARLTAKRAYSAVCCLFCVCVSFSIIATPFGKPVYSAMGVNTSTFSNPIEGDVKFRENSFLAFLVENSSAKITEKAERYVPPEDIKGAIASVLQPKTEATSGIQPNIVVIMCESYADFRTLFEGVSDGYYKNFDSFRKEGSAFTNIVPTFGGSTVRTEFELLFGLPMMSLPDVALPQFSLEPRETQVTIAAQLKGKGYHGTYIHPYHSDFYGRDDKYSKFGFDELIFLDNLEDREKIGWYMSDAAVGEVIVEKINEVDEPLYIHATTMQNHQPYFFDEELSEYRYYMNGVLETDRGLGMLKAQLEAISEPTIVLFTGDHLPNFVETAEDSLLRVGRTFYNPYSALGLTAASAHKIYREEGFVWSNYSADLSAFSDDISTFYLPHMVLSAAEIGLSPLSNTMLNTRKTVPVYSTNYLTKIARHATLDLLTYDIVYGDCFSDR